MTELKQYTQGDIIAVLQGERAVSCRAVEPGVGETKDGTMIYFEDDQVIWRLGHNRKWPTFVYRAFRGEYNETINAICAENERKRQEVIKDGKKRTLFDLFRQDKFGKTKGQRRISRID